MSKKSLPEETELEPSDGGLLLPVLPLRDVVVYPGMVIPLFVGRRKSIRAVEAAMAASKQILLLTQKQAETDDPDPDHIYSVGTISSILQLLELPDGTVKVLVEGANRARVDHYERMDDYFSAQISMLAETQGAESAEIEGLVRSLHKGFEQYVKVNKKIPPEALASLSGIDNASRLTDTISAHMTLKLDEKQKILEILSVRERIEALLKLIESELDILSLEKQIRGRVKQQMEKSQREYYLNEQMKAIQQELSDNDEGASETDELAEKIEKAGMSAEAKKKATHELGKLRMMSPMSAEATVVRNYIDWLVNVPWKKRSRVCRDLKKAERVLEKDHYGLDKVKERILEYLAVQNRVKKIKGPILCLVGPPGVGKTSLGQSIARATGREFTRMSLGGVRDEAEIRGHRRTYIGSLPGKIIQNMSRVGVRNPLFLLDEIDKMAMDFRGDPASALLEVLDPEQNHMFNDHYLEVDFDLSDVMFVCTANTLKIPPALLDRMEVIRISGYTEDEKMNIARRYLIPKQLKNNGLKKSELLIPGPRDPERDPLLHARGGRPEPGAGTVQDLPQDGQAAAAQAAQGTDSDHRGTVAEAARRPSLPVRAGRREQPDRPGQRPGLDRGRRRVAAGGGRDRHRLGETDLHRAARRHHAGVDQGGTDGRAQSGQDAGHPAGFP